MTGYVLGADVGGSSTRVALADTAGRVWAQAEAGGANPVAVGPEAAAAVISAAAEEALRRAATRLGTEPTPQVMVVGLAGGSRVAADARFLRLVAPRPQITARVVSDLEVAFASGTADVDGGVLVAGTGAVAGRLVGGRLVEVRDGWGWLLGDEGAGFWLGREAVRSTLRQLEQGAELQGLHRAVLAATHTSDRVGLVGVCYSSPPLQLARLAPLVSRHAELDTETQARAIAATAADRLADLALQVHHRPGPLVLAGSVATSAGVVSDLLHQRLRADPQTADATVLSARSGLAGAVWLALRAFGGSDRGLHDHLVAALSEEGGSAIAATAAPGIDRPS